MAIPLIIFAKAPIAGRVKTRLIPALGAQGAKQLHAQLLEHTASQAALTRCAPLILCTALEHEHPLFCQLAHAYGISLLPQTDGDLGERMHAALAKQPASALLIGSDAPLLNAAMLDAAATALVDTDAVFLPAHDGGYALVGVQKSDPRLFQHVDWGSAQVMAQTRVNLKALGWRWSELPAVWDVDRPEDLTLLWQHFPEWQASPEE